MEGTEKSQLGYLYVIHWSRLNPSLKDQAVAA